MLSSVLSTAMHRQVNTLKGAVWDVFPFYFLCSFGFLWSVIICFQGEKQNFILVLSTTLFLVNQTLGQTLMSLETHYIFPILVR